MATILSHWINRLTHLSGESESVAPQNNEQEKLARRVMEVLSYTPWTDDADRMPHDDRLANMITSNPALNSTYRFHEVPLTDVKKILHSAVLNYIAADPTLTKKDIVPARNNEVFRGVREKLHIEIAREAKSRPPLPEISDEEFKWRETMIKAEMGDNSPGNIYFDLMQETRFNNELLKIHDSGKEPKGRVPKPIAVAIVDEAVIKLAHASFGYIPAPNGEMIDNKAILANSDSPEGHSTQPELRRVAGMFVEDEIKRIVRRNAVENGQGQEVRSR